nr:RNA-binding protein 33-like [Penaeus vannamei]
MSDLWSDEEQESELMEEQEEEVEGRRQGDNDMEDILETDEDEDMSVTGDRDSRRERPRGRAGEGRGRRGGGEGGAGGGEGRRGGREGAEGRNRGEEDGQQRRGGRPDEEQSPPPPSPPPQPPVVFPPPSLTPQPEEDAGVPVPSWSSVLNTLGPDHPLLKRFQEAKRRQLLQEKDQLQLRLRQLSDHPPQQSTDVEHQPHSHDTILTPANHSVLAVSLLPIAQCLPICASTPITLHMLRSPPMPHRPIYCSLLASPSPCYAQVPVTTRYQHNASVDTDRSLASSQPELKISAKKTSLLLNHVRSTSDLDPQHRRAPRIRYNICLRRNHMSRSHTSTDLYDHVISTLAGLITLPRPRTTH